MPPRAGALCFSCRRVARAAWASSKTVSDTKPRQNARITHDSRQCARRDFSMWAGDRHGGRKCADGAGGAPNAREMTIKMIAFCRTSSRTGLSIQCVVAPSASAITLNITPVKSQVSHIKEPCNHGAGTSILDLTADHGPCQGRWVVQ